VKLDGSHLHEWPSVDLGAHIGYLPQDVELFGGTVRDNIARQADDWTSERILDAARLANVDKMVKFMPQGYQTVVGNGGTLLSGGQMQRVGLARALYGDVKLVVLDEPNANLDAHGEEALAAAIEELKRRGVTVVLILHRPNILKVLDYVMVLVDGKIQRIGPREEMLPILGGGGGSKQPDDRAINVVTSPANA
jgi:ABC-type protease/lipase transport system fused ATPase/permease subunit